MFVVILAEACRPFLTRLQSMRPLIQELLPRCCQLFLALAENIMKPDKIPQTAGDIAMLNLKDSSLFKAASEATYMKTLSKTLEGLDKAEKSKLADEFLAACKAQLEYLKDHLPFKSRLLQCVIFADPCNRKLPDLQDRGNIVANIFKRFSDSERAKIAVALNIYKTLPDTEVPSFDDVKDRVDHWWAEMFQVLTKAMSEPPSALIKLIKLTLSLPHGQAGVESGFSNTKSIVDGRECLADKSVKAQRMIQSAVRRAGGAHNVSVTTSMLNSVKGASAKYRKDLEEENLKKRKAEEEAEVAAALKKKKEEFNAEKKSWQEKRDEVENKIKVVEEQLNWVNKELKAAVGRGEKATDLQVMSNCFKQVSSCQARIKEKTDDLSQLQAKLARLMEKKPKEK